MYNYPSIQLQNNNQPYFHLDFFFSFLFLIGTRLLYQDYLARRIKSLGKGLHMLTRPCLCLVPSVFSCFFLGGEWRNRILLCRVDVDQPEEALQQAQIWDDLGLGSRETHPERKVTIAAFHGKLSLLLAWTDAEARQLLWKYPVANTDHWDHFCVIFWVLDTDTKCQVPFFISDFKANGVDTAFFRKAAAYLETLHKYQSKGAEAQWVVRKWKGAVKCTNFSLKNGFDAWTLDEKNHYYHGIWMNMKHMYCMHLHQEHVQTAAESGIPAGWRLWEVVWPRETIILDCWRCWQPSRPEESPGCNQGFQGLKMGGNPPKVLWKKRNWWFTNGRQ